MRNHASHALGDIGKPITPAANNVAGLYVVDEANPAPHVLDARHDVAPEIRRRGIAVLEQNRITSTHLDVRHRRIITRPVATLENARVATRPIAISRKKRARLAPTLRAVATGNTSAHNIANPA